MKRPPSLLVSATIATLISRVRHKLNRQNDLNASNEEARIVNLHEPSEHLQYSSVSSIFRGETHDGPAVAARAMGIRTEVRDKYAAHKELWERLETLILNALENRTPDQNQYGD